MLDRIDGLPVGAREDNDKHLDKTIVVEQSFWKIQVFIHEISDIVSVAIYWPVLV